MNHCRCRWDVVSKRAALPEMSAGLTPEQITAEYPSVSLEGVRAAAAYGAALARGELLPIPQTR